MLTSIYPSIRIASGDEEAAAEGGAASMRVDAGEGSVLPPSVDEPCTVWVSNLDTSVGEDTLKQIFEQCKGLREVHGNAWDTQHSRGVMCAGCLGVCPTRQIRLVRDFTKRSKGFAYVDFETHEDAAAASDKLNGHKIHDRPLKVRAMHTHTDGNQGGRRHVVCLCCHRGGQVLLSHPTRPLYDAGTVYIKDLPDETTEDDVASFFKTRAGVHVKAVRLQRDDKGHLKGWARGSDGKTWLASSSPDDSCVCACLG